MTTLEATRPASSTAMAWRQTAISMALDVAAPLAVFYGARAAGFDQWWALVLGAVPGIIGIALTWIRQRRLSSIGVFVLAGMALSVLVALFTGDPRALLARESWLSGALGLWMMASLLFSRPLLLDFMMRVAGPAGAARYDRLWQGNRVFHRWFVIASIVWGTSFAIDAGIRVIMAYSLPVDRVPGLSTLLLVVMLCIGHGTTLLYGRRIGVFALLRDKGGEDTGVRDA
ncbi:MAG TPA: VC0807 family protein [Pseudonocardiaceae bacterium]|nr:VC0807 family protein [Pseudonocardiaceae bacterium]